MGNWDTHVCTHIHTRIRTHILTTVTNKPVVPTPERPSLSDLQNELLDTASDKWENIGICLEIDDKKLTQIKSNNPSSGACLIEMLRVWLNRVSPPPCWSAIADAIERLGDPRFAHNLRSKYCMDCDSSCWLYLFPCQYYHNSVLRFMTQLEPVC